MVIDALVNAGTNPSLMIVRDWIVSGRLQGEQAVRAIASLPGTVKTPTKELLSNLIVRNSFRFSPKNPEI